MAAFGIARSSGSNQHEIVEAYRNYKQKFEAGEKSEVPFYVHSLFVHGPHRYTILNLNLSFADVHNFQEGELAEEKRAYLVLKQLAKMIELIRTGMKRKNRFTFSIQPHISDRNRYLVDYFNLFEDMVVPWLKPQGFHYNCVEEPALGAKKLTISVSRSR